MSKEFADVLLYAGSSGIIRLDSILHISDHVTVEINKAKKLAILRPTTKTTVSSYKIWKSNPGALSPMMSIRAVLNQLEIAGADCARKYKATVSRDGRKITIDFSSPTMQYK